MKFQISAVVCVFLIASSAIAQTGDYGPTSLTAVGKANGGIQEGVDMVCDDLDSLMEGFLGGQFGTLSWAATSDVLVVDVGGGDLEAQTTNNLGDDTFRLHIFADVDASGFTPLADDGLTIQHDFAYDVVSASRRFYAPQDAFAGFIFTRVGDSSGDGNWEVLETDGAGGGIFFQTGVAIAASGTLRYEILDEAMDIFVDGVMIYSGGIIGSAGDPGITPPEQLTSYVTQAVDDFGGLGSTENFDNLAINTDDCGGGGKCGFALGDINEDGAVNLFDVDPFVAELAGGSTLCQADINGDGVVDLFDVDPFVALLAGGG